MGRPFSKIAPWPQIQYVCWHCARYKCSYYYYYYYYCFLGPPECTSQTAFRSFQQFLQGSRSWQTDRQTDRPTDHATRSVTIDRIYAVLWCGLKLEAAGYEWQRKSTFCRKSTSKSAHQRLCDCVMYTFTSVVENDDRWEKKRCVRRKDTMLKMVGWRSADYRRGNGMVWEFVKE